MSIKKYSEFNEAKIKSLSDLSDSTKTVNIKDDTNGKESINRGFEIYKRNKRAYDSLEVGDKVVYQGNSFPCCLDSLRQLKNRVGKEGEVIDKGTAITGHAHTQVKVKFDDNVRVWIDAISLKKVTLKNKIKWYSKGKLHDEEGWAKENKDFTGMPIINQEKYINLSYELEPLKDLKNLAKNLTDEQYCRYIIENVNKVFQNLLNRRIVIIAKKCIDQKRYMKDPLRWGEEKKQSIIIYSYFPQDGSLLIRANDGDGDVYLVDLVKCANNPDKYPILVRSITIVSSDDPYGEEEWAD
jgi:hypothetical protein